MRYFAFSLFILALFLIQSTLLNIVKFFNVKPDLLLMCVVIASFYFDNKTAIIFSVLAGFFKDIVSLGGIGVNILVFVACAFMVGQILKRIFIDNDLSRIILMALVVLASGILAKPLLSFKGYPIPIGIYSRILFIEILYTSLTFPFIYRISVPLSKMTD